MTKTGAKVLLTFKQSLRRRRGVGCVMYCWKEEEGKLSKWGLSCCLKDVVGPAQELKESALIGLAYT